MRHGFTGFIFVAMALATAAPSRAGDGGLPGAAPATAAPQQQIATIKKSSCTCRRNRWIMYSGQGLIERAGRRKCLSVYRRSKIRGAKLARYHPGTGKCYICYRGDVICPRGVGSGGGTGTGTGRIPPPTTRLCSVPVPSEANWHQSTRCRSLVKRGWRNLGTSGKLCFQCPPGYGWMPVKPGTGYRFNIACRHYVKKRC